MGVQFERNNSEEEVDVLCESAVNSGSSGVRNMARVCFFFFMTRTEMLQFKHLSVRPGATRTRQICACASVRGESSVY